VITRWSEGQVRRAHKFLGEVVSIPRSSRQRVPRWPCCTCYEIVLPSLPTTTKPGRKCNEPWAHPKRSQAIQTISGVTLGVPGTAGCRQGRFRAHPKRSERTQAIPKRCQPTQANPSDPQAGCKRTQPSDPKRSPSGPQRSQAIRSDPRRSQAIPSDPRQAIPGDPRRTPAIPGATKRSQAILSDPRRTQRS
jgi:hypothetical protein